MSEKTAPDALEALRLALEALNDWKVGFMDRRERAIDAVRAALATAEAARPPLSARRSK